MKIIYLAFLLICIISCSNKGSGTIKGNVFWKYNNFIGNKPDAGSEAALYSVKDSTLFFKTQADVAGDYTFDKVPEGEYYVIVQSKNTIGSPKDLFRKTFMYQPLIEKLAKQPFPPNFKDSVEKFNALDSINLAQTLNNTPFDKRIDYQPRIDSLCKNSIDLLPLDIRMITGILTLYSHKVDFQFVKVEKNKTSTLITDFGITYL